MNKTLWLLALVIAESRLLLPVLKDGVFDRRNLSITSAIVVAQFATPLLGFGDSSSVWKCFLAQVLLFSSFVYRSRIRQRRSFFLMVLANVVSTGGWFLTVQVLAATYLSPKQGIGTSGCIGLLVAAISGALVGRLVGVKSVLWVENRWQIRLNSVGSATVRCLDSYTQLISGILLLGSISVCGTLKLVPIGDLLITTALGFTQNAVHTINERFGRNHPGWPVLTGFLGGIVFMVNWSFMIGYTKSGGFVPLVLLVPYALAMVAGGNLSADLWMALERLLNLDPDSDIVHGESHADLTWHKAVLVFTAASCAAYLATSGYILGFFGLTTHQIVLPFVKFAGVEFDRPASLLIAGLLFFARNIMRRLSNRAGKGNNWQYYAVTRLMHGLVIFGTGTFVVLNARFLDLVPAAAFGFSLGQLFVQRWSMRAKRLPGSVVEGAEGPELKKVRCNLPVGNELVRKHQNESGR